MKRGRKETMQVASDPSGRSRPETPTTNKLRRRASYQFGSLVREKRTRGPDVWVYRYSKQIDGKKRRLKEIVGTLEQFPTKDNALRACEHLRMAANIENPRAGATMRGLIDRYQENVLNRCLDVPVGGTRDEDAELSYSTAVYYKGQLRNYIRPRWENYQVSAFDEPQIWAAAETWFRSLKRSANNPEGLAPKTVRLIYAVMGAVLKHAVKWGYLKQNPFFGKDKGIEPPRGSTLRLDRAAQLTPTQFFQLVPLLSPRAKVAVAFAGWLGPRGSEVFGQKWKDLDLEAAVTEFRRGCVLNRITPCKNVASRTRLPLPKELVDALRDWRSITPYNRPDDWVFASNRNAGKTPVDRFHMMTTEIQSVAHKLGLPHISWHSFRHSLSAWGKECLNGEDRKTLLRHASLASGEGYGDVELEKKREIQQRLAEHVRPQGLKQENPCCSENTLFTPAVSILGSGSSVATEHELRSAAAHKAWATIRAKRAAKKLAAAEEAEKPLTLDGVGTTLVEKILPIVHAQVLPPKTPNPSRKAPRQKPLCPVFDPLGSQGLVITPKSLGFKAHEQKGLR